MKSMTELTELFPSSPVILDGVIKLEDHIRDGSKIICDLSGGVDSEILVHMMESLSYEPWQVEYFNFNHNTNLDDLAKKYGIHIRYSNKTHRKIARELGADLYVNEVRRVDKPQYRSCFTPAGSWIAKFRPLFYMTDTDRRIYLDFIHKEN